MKGIDKMLLLITKERINTFDFIRKGIKKYCELFDISLPEYRIYRNDMNKPCLDPDFIEISLSHSEDYTILGLSKKELGIDIQKYKELDHKLIMKRFFHPDDKCQSKRDFFNHWAAKEAFVKRNNMELSTGMKTNITNKNITLLNIFASYSLAIDSEDKDILFMFI